MEGEAPCPEKGRPLHRITVLFTRAREVYQTDGFVGLLRRGLAFAVGPFFFCRTYYVYKEYIEDLAEAEEADFVPEIEGLTFRIVSSNEEADELEAQGFPFRSQVANARRNLEKGATAFCLFVGQELASIAWHAPNRDAQRSLGEPAYPVDYERDEISSGGLWSNPRYRRKGLRRYSRLKRIEFLRDSGVKARWGAIAKHNVLAFSGRGDFQPSAFAEGRYLRVLWWKWWKERPVTPQQGEETAKRREKTDRAGPKSSTSLSK